MTAKQKILQLVQDQPEDSSYDEILLTPRTERVFGKFGTPAYPAER